MARSTAESHAIGTQSDGNDEHEASSWDRPKAGRDNGRGGESNRHGSLRTKLEDGARESNDRGRLQTIFAIDDARGVRSSSAAAEFDIAVSEQTGNSKWSLRGIGHIGEVDDSGDRSVDRGDSGTESGENYDGEARDLSSISGSSSDFLMQLRTTFEEDGDEGANDVTLLAFGGRSLPPDGDSAELPRGDAKPPLSPARTSSAKDPHAERINSVRVRRLLWGGQLLRQQESNEEEGDPGAATDGACDGDVPDEFDPDGPSFETGDGASAEQDKPADKGDGGLSMFKLVENAIQEATWKRTLSVSTSSVSSMKDDSFGKMRPGVQPAVVSPDDDARGKKPSQSASRLPPAHPASNASASVRQLRDRYHATAAATVTRSPTDAVVAPSLTGADGLGEGDGKSNGKENSRGRAGR